MKILILKLTICLLLISTLAYCTIADEEQFTPHSQPTPQTRTQTSTPEPTSTDRPRPLAFIVTPTQIPPQNPIPGFPLTTGNTWIYSSTHYHVDTRTGQRITATYIITKQVMSVKTYDKGDELYFIAHLHENALLVEGVTPELAPPDLNKDFLYIIDKNLIYLQRQSRAFNVFRFRTTRYLLYKFPLLDHTECWYPDLHPDLQAELFGEENCPSWGYRYIEDLPELTVPVGKFEGCASVIQTGQGAEMNEWICPGIGAVEEESYGFGQRGRDSYTPEAGYKRVLITYTLQTP